MTVEDPNPAVEDYYWTKAVFFTEKENHTVGDKNDEISTYVVTSKTIFDQNIDIMQQAAKAGGVNGYTIRWKNLNGPEDDDFVYEVKL